MCPSINKVRGSEVKLFYANLDKLMGITLIVYLFLNHILFYLFPFNLFKFIILLYLFNLSLVMHESYLFILFNLQFYSGPVYLFYLFYLQLCIGRIYLFYLIFNVLILFIYFI